MHGGAWCRSEAAPVGAVESRAFPYAVVEVKVQGGMGRPQWVENLIASGAPWRLHATADCYPSKYLCALLLRQRSPVAGRCISREASPFWVSGLRLQ